MKRRLVILAMFLLAGAVVNVAVAWGCAGSQENYRSVSVSVPLAPGSERRIPLVLDTFGKQFVLARRATGHDPLLPHWSVKRKRPEARIDFEEAAGWPLLSLRCTVWSPDTSKVRQALLHGKQPAMPDSTLEGGIARGGPRHYSLPSGVGVTMDGPGNRTIPLLPIWPGFAVNTLFYAAILWLLIRGPFVLRRLIRVRRGLCPKCGYNLGHAEHGACPECGHAWAGSW